MSKETATRPAADDESEEDAALASGVTGDLVHQVEDYLDEGLIDQARVIATELHDADEADLLEQLDPERRLKLLEAIRSTIDPEMLVHLRESVRDELLEVLSPDEIADIVTKLDSDDAIELIEDMPEERQRDVLRRVSGQLRAIVEQGLNYPEYSAGRLLQREVVALPQFWTVGKTIDYLRAAEENLPESFYDIYVVDPMHKVVGVVGLSRLIRTKRSKRLTDIAAEITHRVAAETDQEDVADLFRRYSLVTAPVVDEHGRLLGVITIDDVIDVIDEEAEDDLLKLSGVGESDIYSAIWATIRSRFGWLLINLGTAVAASLVIGAFEATIEQVVALAVLMPIVASMGGNAGTQTLTVAVRALATKELSSTTALRVVWKETLVACANGIAFALIAGVIAALWFNEPILGLVIGMAMIATLAIAGLSGVLIPLGLSRAGVDPAIASAVFLTTITDIVGFFTFLGIAAWILL